MCHTLIFVLNKTKYFLHFFNPFLAFFSTLPSTQTIKVINLIFFQSADLEKLGFEHAFQPYIYSLRPFSKGGGRKTPPSSLYIDSDPPAFIGLKKYYLIIAIF